MPFPARTSPEAILDEFERQAELGTLAAVTMRSIAGALGLQVSSLYHHFPDRAMLEAALAARAARQLRALIAPTLAPGKARRTLRGASAAYRQFASAHPTMYALLNATPAQGSLELERDGKALWNEVLAVIEAAGGRRDDTPAAVALWSLLHGFVSLEAAGLFGASGPKGGLDFALDALAASLKDPSRPRG